MISFFLRQKGFTIIELIVVIAIIALLASIVMISTTSYISGSRDSAIKANLVSLLSRGTEYLESTGNYNAFCTSNLGGAPIKSVIESSKIGGTFICNCNIGGNNCVVNPTKWCACSTLISKSGDTICVDSSNYKKQTSNVGGCVARCVNGACLD